jgi:hypothetical protein
VTITVGVIIFIAGAASMLVLQSLWQSFLDWWYEMVERARLAAGAVVVIWAVIATILWMGAKK